MVGCHKGIREIETNVANALRVVNPTMYPVLQEIINLICSDLQVTDKVACKIEYNNYEIQHFQRR